MNADEFAAIRARHRMEVADGNCAGSYSWNPEGWYRPQGHDLDLAVEDIGKLVAEVERLRGVVEAVLREHTPEAPDGRADRCRLCSPQEKRWPCSTVLEARAALEGKE